MCRNVIASFLACHESGKGSPHRQVHSSHSQLLPLGVAATKARTAAPRGPVQAPLPLPSLDAWSTQCGKQQAPSRPNRTRLGLGYEDFHEFKRNCEAQPVKKDSLASHVPLP